MPNHLHVSSSDRRRAACGGLSVRHAHLGVESERQSSFSAVIPARIPAELTEAQGALSLLRATSDAHIHVKEHPKLLLDYFSGGGLGISQMLCSAVGYLLYVASLSPTYAEDSIPFIKASALLRQNGLQLQAPAAEQRLGCNRMDLPPSGSDSAPQWPRAGNSKSFPPAAYT